MSSRAEADPPRIGGLILAAGEARRFGAQKLLARLDGRPLVQHVIDAANASSLADIVLVVGANAEELVAQLDVGRTRVVGNPDPARGLASSLQVGLRGLAQRLHAALVLLGDMPGVTTALIDELLARGRETRVSGVISLWRGRRSPPVVLHRSLWADAFALQGDIGMRDVLAGRDDVIEVAVTEALAALDDVDTPEDHRRLASSGRRRLLEKGKRTRRVTWQRNYEGTDAPDRPETLVRKGPSPRRTRPKSYSPRKF